MYNIYKKKFKAAYKSRIRLSATDNRYNRCLEMGDFCSLEHSQKVSEDLENQVGFGQSVIIEF